jgi:hypothetical protein
MLTILTGDKGSSGDALIVDRGVKLLKHFHPAEEILKLDRWKPVDDYLDQVNQSRALILLGGPAFEKDIYPGIYPLVADLNRIKVPIVSMGLGASLLPCNETAISQFRFDAAARPLLDRLVRDAKTVGIRDYITKRVLVTNGLHNAEVIGCPAWYNMETLGRPIRAPKIETVAFAPGVRHLYFNSRASSNQQQQVMKLLKDMFPAARRYAVFQDSLENDNRKPLSMRRIQRSLANEAQRLGYEVVDCTHNLGNMLDAYERADLLVGYRVHSHICMLSLGKPSVLIPEDSRGYGMNDFVGLASFPSFIDSQGALDWLYLHSQSARIIRRLYPPRPNSQLIRQVRDFLEQGLESGFALYAGVPEVIRRYFAKMEMFIQRIAPPN